MGINTTTAAVSIPCGNCNVNIDARARHLDTGIESMIDERARFTLLLFVIVNALFPSDSMLFSKQIGIRNFQVTNNWNELTRSGYYQKYDYDASPARSLQF